VYTIVELDRGQFRNILLGLDPDRIAEIPASLATSSGVPSEEPVVADDQLVAPAQQLDQRRKGRLERRSGVPGDNDDGEPSTVTRRQASRMLR
jgi:hypothetical protein